jgi:1-acyl-sn-glycerol-3-phosphate acyltransferase
LIAYLTLRRLLRLAALTYFRRLQVVGQEHVPETGPVMFCGNHPNALLDPVLITCFCGRVVRFATKDTLFDNWLLRPFLAILGAVPVKRKQDHAGAAVSNEPAFEKLFEVLADGHAVGIFPEGISHDASQLARLKTGAARIAFGFQERHPGLRVPVVPCGLNYVTPDRFRSSVLVQFGRALTIEDAQLEAYRMNRPQAVHAFTAELQARLRSLTVNAEDWETIRVLDGVRRLYQPPRLPFEQRIELARRFNSLYPQVRDEPVVRRLYARVRAYLDRLAAAGLTDRDLRRTMRRRETVLRVVRHVTLVVVWLPLALLGAVIHLPLGLLLDVTGDRLNPDRTLRATLKFTLGVALLLAIYFAVPIAIGMSVGWGLGLAAFVLLPLSGYATLRVAERAVALRQIVRASMRVLTLASEVRALQAERETLQVEIAQAVERYGPGDGATRPETVPDRRSST